MAKYADVRTAGRSATVPFVEGQEASLRHDRRLCAAMERLAEARARCEAWGVELNVTNGGHHWQFRTRQTYQRQLDWWPSSAKLVIDQQWKRGIHAHDLDQVLKRVASLRQAGGNGMKEAIDETVRCAG